MWSRVGSSMLPPTGSIAVVSLGMTLKPLCLNVLYFSVFGGGQRKRLSNVDMMVHLPTDLIVHHGESTVEMSV